VSWTPSLALPTGDLPLSTRIARGITADIRRGRLLPGARLPGSRRLAQTLGVHRNTVLSALNALEAEGWIRTEPARGTFICETLPLERPQAFGAGPVMPRTLALPPPPPDVMRPAPERGEIALLGGLPDLTAAPTPLLARAWRRAVRRGATVLGYGDPRGDAAIRGALAEMLRDRRGLACSADDLLVTRGSQMAIFLAAQAVLRPGDHVAVECLGYRPAWAALTSTGATLTPIALDPDGLCIEALQTAHRATPFRAVYLTPHHQYPTTVTLSAPRRLALLAWAAAEGVLIIEDDYDNEFHYDQRPILPLAQADRAGVVLYIGTLSKVFAPSTRMGYTVGPAPLLESMTRWRVIIDRQGDRITEAAVAELLGDGELPRHVRRMKRIYQRRRDTAVQAVRRHLPRVDFTVPAGGMALWLRTPPDISAAAWTAAAQSLGVHIQAGAGFHMHSRDVPAVRLGFAAHPPEVLDAAIATLAQAWPV
jgi:GntR family transcriptional regulator/MocR family aminotransferase